MVAAAAVIVIGSATVVAIGPAGLAPWSRSAITTDPAVPPVTTGDHVSTDSRSSATPKTPVSTTAPTAPAQVTNEIAAGQGQREQLRKDLQLSDADAGSATTRGRVEQLGASVPTAATPEPYGTVVDPYARPPSTGDERYGDFKTNPVKLVSEEPVSTFSIDVDTAAYANVRRFLTDGTLPPMDAVRTEELINYFPYAYPLPESKEEPFRADVAVFDSPWDSGSQIVRIGLQGYDIPKTTRPPANLVFLVDTSGSMQDPDKLPLVKQSLRLLTEQMQPTDSISIVAYAGDAGVVLEPTKGSERMKILSAIEAFSAGGSTAGAEGIRQAYALAETSFQKNAINRVILATDGDFNVGITDPSELEDFVARKRDTGVYLSVLGFGTGNLNDLMMQKLAQAGNGNASYIDSLMEARKVLVDEMGSTIFTIANDVKIQIEFNPALVAEYRLIGYETRLLNREDFNNDKVDAGEVGSGHAVTALYEITAPDSKSRLVDDLHFQPKPDAPQPDSNALAWLKIRYKLPGETESRLIQQPIEAAARTSFEAAPAEARFAVAVAAFGQLLRKDPNVGSMTLADVQRIAAGARGEDAFGYRGEFLRLVQVAQSSAALEPLN
jgi:Ca-activated chloride channel family protein